MSRTTSAPSSKNQTQLVQITEQNIHTIINTPRVTANQRATEEHLVDIGTNFSGRTYFDLLTVLLFGLIGIGTVTFLRLKKKKSLAYLLFFTIFYVYIVKVLDYTLFQFQSLILLNYFMPDLILNGLTAGKSLNLIPLITLTPQDLKTSLLNILLLIPFGFGLPFITDFRMKKIVVMGALFSIGIELLQLITGFLAKITFRIADINDVIFNTVGVAIGYILFVGFMRIYRHVSDHWQIAANPILRYIAERPQIDR
ncbi:MAG: VanZ family protein [Anaerolineae bacterium]|nr:VanZ family protein [Anaerolineae bacterium]